MPNQVRIGVGTTGVKGAESDLDRLRGKFDQFQKQGAKGFAIGAGAAVTAKGLSLIDNALTGVVQGAFDSIAAASSLSESLSKSRVVFGQHSAAMERWAEGAADAFGQSKRQALEAAGTYGNLFQAFGFGQDEATKMSKKLVELASDLASFNNTSVDDAILALRSGLSGETEPLKRYGVALSDARMRQELMSQGVKKLGATLTPLQKTTAAYALVLKDTKLAQGDFASTANGLANTQKTITAQMEDASAAIGEELLPLALELAHAFKDDVIPAFKGFAELLGALSGDGLPNTADGVSDLLHLVQMFNPIARQAADGLDDAVSDMNESTTRVAEAVSARSGEMRGDLLQVDDAFETLADGASSSGTIVTTSLTTMRDGVRKLEDAFVASAKRIIGDYYDPIELRQEQLTLKREAGEQRAIIASKDSTKEQIKDAKHRLTQINRRQTEILVELGATGKASAKELGTAITQWQKKAATAKGSALADIRAIMRALVLLRFAALQASGALVVGRAGLNPGGGGGRAAGGPVVGGTSYVVGEKGPELFVPSGSGTIIPNGGGMALAGAGGGITLNFYFPGMVVAPTQAQAKVIGDVIGPAVAGHLRSRGLIPR